MRTFPFIVTMLAIWLIFVAALYLTFGFTAATLMLAALSIGGVAVSVFTYRYYGWPYADKSTFVDITPSDLYALMEKGERVVIVDVRGAGEFERGHLPGSQNMPLSRVSRGQAVTEKTVFVSGRGRRSRMAIRRARGKELLNLRDGYAEWVEENLPVEKGTAGI